MTLDDFIKRRHLSCDLLLQCLLLEDPDVLNAEASEFDVRYERFKKALERYTRSSKGPYEDDRLRLYVEAHDLVKCLKDEGLATAEYDLRRSFLSTDEINVILLKAIHERHTQEELADMLRCSVQAVQSRVKDLREGIRIVGASVKTDVKDGAFVQSSVHPIVLPLNLSELYYLTTLLAEASLESDEGGNPRPTIATILARKIYSQMSDYAKGVLEPHLHEMGVSLEKSEDNCFWGDDGQDDLYLMYEKSGARVRVVHDKGIFEGKMLMGRHMRQTGRPALFLELDDGSIKELEWGGVASVERS